MTTPAGWYQDPNGDGQRYWDGERWTEHVAPLSPATPDAAAASSHDAPVAAPLAAEAPAAAERKSPAKLIGGLAAAAVVAVAGFFAYTQLASASGGADSPEEAVANLMAAVSDEDLVGMSEALLPGERRTFVDPALEGLGHLQRWGVLGESYDSSDVAGIDLEVDDLDLSSDEVADDIVNVRASGTIRASIDGEELPVGDLLRDRALQDQDMSELDTESTSERFDGVQITTVREDGRWYVSMMFTAAEEARAEMGAAPIAAGDGVAPVGADSAGAAVEGMIDAVADLDLEGIIARLNPDEAQALQRYAPLFLDEAQAEIDQMRAETGLELEVSGVDYDIVERDGFAVVQFTGIAMSGSVDGEEFAFDFADGCVSVTVEGETEEQCTPEIEVDMSDSPIGDIGEIFSDMDELGLVVAERDGEWYVSPIRTYSDIILAVMRAIDRDELEAFIDSVEDGSFVAWIETQLEESFENAFEFSEGVVDDAVGGSIGGIGGSSQLADLREACGDGDMEACDDLYFSTPIGSDDEEYGSTCGGTSSPTRGGCADLDEGSGSTPSTTVVEGAAAAAASYGDDVTLDALWDGCEAGDAAQCDELYVTSAIGTEYREFGASCGGRHPGTTQYCVDAMSEG